MQPNRRLPAEWEPQDGVLLAWPHEESDWHPYLEVVEPVFVEIVREISRFERVVIAAPDPERVRKQLQDGGALMERVRVFGVETNDTWARDFGPITVQEEGEPVLLNFGFNGWGLKFAADLDNRINKRLQVLGAWNAPLQRPGLILEGGSIESDGKGTILSTEECLLNDNRNPHLTREELEQELHGLLGSDRFLWLGNGYLAGDDTDSHVDTLARLCPNDTIAYVRCDDPEDEHYQALKAMEEEIAAFRTRDGRPYRMIPLPWPAARFDEDGERLPATYANFLVINGAVLVPTYDDPNDDRALAAVGEAFPGREIVGVNCLPLILQHGSLHCVTMQMPEGTLRTE
ncbi:agmatine deiminase family protein [Geomonas sp. RF6]|uniref:agmatine deiminase family protein n=1 Tax=Geomonas sp. RF6 TaxID=2897342 RepID=UPI001E578B85|nr:agmatine deiminase family protein [Geomonas sp. RF6]UFS70563.1 agmatine deiminase family protein [Geomonas sp. RF6]